MPIHNNRQRAIESSPHGWVIASFLVAVFLLGGAARADVWSLLLLRPLAVLALAFCFMSMDRSQWQPVKVPAMILGCAAIMVALQLIPLPPALWTALPGREIAADSFRVLGTAINWQPFSLDPFMGWNALMALVVPAAMLGLLVKSGQAANRLILNILLIVLTASVLLGLLQLLGGDGSPFYLYRITNDGVPVGLFANRNHNAMLYVCGFPLLALWVSQQTGDFQKIAVIRTIGAVAAITLVVMIGVAGSRGALLLMAVAIPLSLMIVIRGTEKSISVKGDNPVVRRRAITVGLIGVGVAVAMVAVTALTGRSVALTRLMGNDAAQDFRYLAMPTMLDMIGLYFPFGSGAGSFVTVYKVAEHRNLLSDSYFNHAHNDVIEIAIEYGLLGMLLVGAIATIYMIAIYRLWTLRRPSQPVSGTFLYGVTGAVLLMLLGLGSVLDYPLRTPSLGSLAAVAAAWLCWALWDDKLPGNKAQAIGDKDRSSQ